MYEQGNRKTVRSPDVKARAILGNMLKLILQVSIY
jgi:hypothetical protein